MELIATMIRAFVVLFFVCSIPALCRAQDLTYEYDFVNKTTVVHHDESIHIEHTTQIPSVTLGHRVHVVVKNINTRLYTIIASGSNREQVIATQSTADLMQKIQPVSPPPALPNYKPKNKPNDDLAEWKSKFLTGKPPDEKPKLKSALLADGLKRLVEEYNSDAFIKNFLLASKGITNQLNQLTTSNGMLLSTLTTQPASFNAAKQSANNAITPFLTGLPDSTYDYSSSILNGLNGKDEMIIRTVLTAQREYIDFDNAYNVLQLILNSYELKPADKLNIQMQCNEVLHDSYSKLYDTLMRQYSEFLGVRTPLENQMVKRYQAIFTTPYDFEFDMPATADAVDIQLKIYRNNEDNTPALDAGHLVAEKNYTVAVEGGWKVNLSSGFGVTSFLGKQKNFYNRGFFNGKPDSTIVESKTDDFSPALALFVNAYSRSASGFALGYTAGIGIPFLSENKSPSLMLGLSAILGNEERLIVSGGVCGGTVNKLKNGFQAGETLQSPTAEVPIEKGYAFGVFLGLSYNLTDFKLP